MENLSFKNLSLFRKTTIVILVIFVVLGVLSSFFVEEIGRLFFGKSIICFNTVPEPWGESFVKCLDIRTNREIGEAELVIGGLPLLLEIVLVFAIAKIIKRKK